jgi:hypothetical protein
VLYPSANQNGSWVFFNLSTKSYVRCTQWTKLPTSKLVIQVMNDMAGTSGVQPADLGEVEAMSDEAQVAVAPNMHMPKHQDLEMTQEEAQIEFDEEFEPPELMDQADDDGVSESSHTDNEMEDEDSESDPDDDIRFEEELKALEVQDKVLDTKSSGSSTPNDNRRAVPLRRTLRENAGVQRYDSNYEWNLMNLSVGAAIRNFGNTAKTACKDELVQLFKEKKAIAPVKWDNLTEDQKKKVVHSHMFLREKYEDGKFVKMKGKFIHMDGKLIVKVEKAMYGLIQSAKLWYKELSRFLEENGFKKCPSDECVMVKKEDGKDAIVVILYVDDILVLSGKATDCYWVKHILENQYQKVTVSKGERLPYLGMTIIKTADGFEICMKAYIEDILKYYERNVREYVTPTNPNLFKGK